VLIDIIFTLVHRPDVSQTLFVTTCHICIIYRQIRQSKCWYLVFYYFFRFLFYDWSGGFR